jgi:hypothetical protein
VIDILQKRADEPDLVKRTCPGSYVDHHGRMRGNLIGIFHLMTGRLTPKYILKLK